MTSSAKVLVIGGGPAGMMAAGRAAELGARVTLIEKNERLGRKLLLCGKGRCNITNAEFEVRPFIERYGRGGRFLYSGLSRFGPREVVEFFERRGVKTKVERGGRVFPVSDRASDVLRALEEYLREGRVKVVTGANVTTIAVDDGRIAKVVAGGGEFEADCYVVAVGGKSYPGTGSRGDGYRWLKQLGHTINAPRPALAPLVVRENWVGELEGLSLRNVTIGVYQNDRKQDERFGEALFTANGLSGPIVLDMSKKTGDLLPQGAVELRIDFKPALDWPTLDKRIRRDFENASKKLFRNSLGALLPNRLIPVAVRLSEIDPDKRVNSISKEERRRLIHVLKEFTLNVAGVDGFDKAIVTAGGVELKEIDPKTMKSRLVDNLHLAGEMLDLDGPTGGYNLQVAWTTGYVAGESCA